MIVVFVQAAAKPQNEKMPTTTAENPARLASAMVRSQDRKSVV